MHATTAAAAEARAQLTWLSIKTIASYSAWKYSHLSWHVDVTLCMHTELYNGLYRVCLPNDTNTYIFWAERCEVIIDGYRFVAATLHM